MLQMPVEATQRTGPCSGGQRHLQTVAAARSRVALQYRAGLGRYVCAKQFGIALEPPIGDDDGACAHQKRPRRTCSRKAFTATTLNQKLIGAVSGEETPASLPKAREQGAEQHIPASTAPVEAEALQGGRS